MNVVAVSSLSFSEWDSAANEVYWFHESKASSSLMWEEWRLDPVGNNTLPVVTLGPQWAAIHKA